ncbi:MAG: GIY-YIG nuclease family protein [Candidatus Omnitrophota bacterium]
MFFVYVLRSKFDKKLYIGSTGLLEERVAAHNGGNVESTKNRRPLELIYYEAYLDKHDAEGREKFLKSGSGHRFLKKQLINFFDSIRGVEQPGSSLGS